MADMDGEESHVTELLGLYYLDALGLAEGDGIEAHLAGCAQCRDLAAQIIDTVASLALLSERDRDEVLDNFGALNRTGPPSERFMRFFAPEVEPEPPPKRGNEKPAKREPAKLEPAKLELAELEPAKLETGGGEKPAKAEPADGERPAEGEPVGGGKPVKAELADGERPAKGKPGERPAKGEPGGSEQPVKAELADGERPAKGKPGERPAKREPGGSERPAKAEPADGERPAKGESGGRERPAKAESALELPVEPVLSPAELVRQPGQRRFSRRKAAHEPPASGPLPLAPPPPPPPTEPAEPRPPVRNEPLGPPDRRPPVHGRRRSAVIRLSGLLALVLVIGGLAFTALLDGGRETGAGAVPVVTAAATAADSATGATLSVFVTQQAAGVSVRATVDGLRAGVGYRLQAVTSDGHAWPVVNWTGDGKLQEITAEVQVPLSTLVFFTVSRAGSGPVVSAYLGPGGTR